MSATQNLKQDHITLKRVRDIAQRCSERLYANQHIPIEDLQIISVVIEEFVDRFHHGNKHIFRRLETKIHFQKMFANS